MNKLIAPALPSYRLRFGTYNLANAAQDEQSETTNFYRRLSAILQLIATMDLDILVLNELRPYRNRDTGKMCYPPEFLGQIEGYDHVYDYNNATGMSFGNAILYKRNKFYPLQTVKR